MRSIWTYFKTSEAVENYLDTLIVRSEGFNFLSEVPHKFRKKITTWRKISTHRQKRFLAVWKYKLKIFASDACRCGVKFTVSELQNLSVSELAQLQEYVAGKSMLKSHARLAIHQTSRGISHLDRSSKDYTLCCICLGPEESARAISQARRFKIKPIRRIAGCVFSGKRR
jgi:hypothetical protein